MTSVALEPKPRPESYLQVVPAVKLPIKPAKVTPLPQRETEIEFHCECLQHKTFKIPATDHQTLALSREVISCEKAEKRSPASGLGMLEKCDTCRFFECVLSHRSPDGSPLPAEYIRRELATLPGSLTFN